MNVRSQVDSQLAVGTDAGNQDRAFRAGYILAIVTTFLPLVVGLAVVLSWRAGGVRSIPSLLRTQYAQFRYPQRTIDLPAPIVEELIALRAVVENADNPTGIERHNTFLVSPDPALYYRLRANVRTSNFMLAPSGKWNLDPPLISILTDSVSSMSPPLRAFIERNLIQSSSYTTNESGFRRTVPPVSSAHKMLMIGASPVFGVGVNDENTIPSALQSRLGSTMEVINAGVSGYNAGMILEYAKELLERERYEIVAFVVHQNQLEGPDQREFVDLIAALGQGRPWMDIIVIFQPYMEYFTFSLNRQWTQAEVDFSDAQYSSFHRAVSHSDRIHYVDVVPAMKAHAAATGTAFSLYSFYVDHAHLSPLGTHLFADRLYEQIRQLRER